MATPSLEDISRYVESIRAQKDYSIAKVFDQISRSCQLGLFYSGEGLARWKGYETLLAVSFRFQDQDLDLAANFERMCTEYLTNPQNAGKSTELNAIRKNFYLFTPTVSPPSAKHT